MMHVGIFTGYYPYGLRETAKKIQAQGMTTVQLDPVFKDMDLSTEGIDKEKCRTIRDVFRDHNLPICCVSGYTNIVHPDKGERKKRLDHLKTIIRRP
jgi:sugar phosphate isomerase/epimerase